MTFLERRLSDRVAHGILLRKNRILRGKTWEKNCIQIRAKVKWNPAKGCDEIVERPFCSIVAMCKNERLTALELYLVLQL